MGDWVSFSHIHLTPVDSPDSLSLPKEKVLEGPALNIFLLPSFPVFARHWEEKERTFAEFSGETNSLKVRFFHFNSSPPESMTIGNPSSFQVRAAHLRILLPFNLLKV
jgi:hypothetical protein